MIESEGGVVDRVRHGRHLVIYWRVGDAKFVTTLANSPSDRRAAANKVAQIRACFRSAVSQNSEAVCVA